MAIQVEVPGMGESVKQATLVHWHKADGQGVKIDEPLCELETDKANVDVPSPSAGVLRHVSKEGDTVSVGEVIGRIDPAGAAVQAPEKAPEKPAPAAVSSTAGSDPDMKPDFKPEDYSPAVRVMLEEHHLDPRSIKATGPNGRLTTEDVQSHLASQGPSGNGRQTAGQASGPAGREPSVADENAERSEVEEESPPPSVPATRNTATAPAATSNAQRDIATTKKAPEKPSLDYDANGLRRTPMSKLRVRIAETLVNAQHTAAILTTFNEIDLSGVMDLRGKYKERFNEVHSVGLGFMSFFAKAVVLALKEFPRVNASIDGTDIVYHQYVHLGIAVSTDRGLVVPVLRNVEQMSFARIELEIKRLAAAARDGKLGLPEMQGATFTITNGGVFGSLLSTPILTPPQSGILGMHAIQQRPVAIDGKVEIRPMMYVALSYDHRLVDGRESVSFLVRLKQSLEDPARLLLEI